MDSADRHTFWFVKESHRLRVLYFSIFNDKIQGIIIGIDRQATTLSSLANVATKKIEFLLTKRSETQEFVAERDDVRFVVRFC